MMLYKSAVGLYVRNSTTAGISIEMTNAPMVNRMAELGCVEGGAPGEGGGHTRTPLVNYTHAPYTITHKRTS